MKTQALVPSISVPNAALPTVKTFDAQVTEMIDFTKLPSVTVDVTKLKPIAVFDKQKEVEAIVNAANSLANEHESYEKQFVEGGRKALYAVLAKIYVLALQVNASDYCDSILKELRTQLKLKKNIKTQKNSNAVTMIVRWVVGGNRQTAHNYSKTLLAAFEDNISASELIEYLTLRGGMQGTKSAGQKKKTAIKELVSKQVDQFMRNADRNHAAYQNTKIQWTEQIYGDFGDHMMILGYSNGAGMDGSRAFYLGANAYRKICAIISEEIFKNKSVQEVEKFVEDESASAFKKIYKKD